MKFFRAIWVLFPLVLVNSIAHENCIEGVVVLKNGDNQPIVGATVRILNTSLGAITDKHGRFHIKEIPKGKYELLITGVGLKPIYYKFEIEKELHKTLFLKFEMEESPIQTADIVVTATRSEKIYEDVPVKVSVVTSKIMQSTSSVDIKEALNFQPGVRTELNCQNCGFSQVRINGLDGRYSQILIDGNPIFSSLNGVYGLEQIPSNMIDRIEVIRGGSSLYGGNAIAGIVNIITKEPSYNSFDVDFTQRLIYNKTNDNTINLNGSIISNEQNIGASLFGYTRERKHWDANGDGFSELGKLDVKTAGARLFYKPNHKSKIGLVFQTLYHKIRGGDSLNNPPHQTNITEQASHHSNLITLKYELFWGQNLNKLTINAGFQNTTRNSYYGSGGDLNAYGSTDNRTFAIGGQFDYIIENLLGFHIISAGYEFNNDWILDKAPAYNRTIDQTTFSNGVFFQDDWNISEDLNIVFGARVEKHNKIKELIFSPRVNLLYKISNFTNLRVAYSTGYRPPQTFDEDLHITQVGGEGLLILVDKNLKPEYSNSFSLSTDFFTKALSIPISFSIEAFATILKDVFTLKNIGRDDNNNLILLRVNENLAIVQGLNLEVQSQISKLLEFKLSLTAQKSEYSKEIEWSSGDPDYGIEPQYSKKIFKSPDIYTYIVANIYPSQSFSIAISGIYTGSMFIPHYSGFVARDVLKKTPKFFELGIKLNYTISSSPQIETYLGIHNIFNSFQKDFDIGPNRDSGYMYGPSRPRTSYAGLKISF
ncbi:MAG: TonB-dependent receptor [Ignavibacteria bacterium]|nr:TonB-dependent receptor [Ignavibacteria bacterium]